MDRTVIGEVERFAVTYVEYGDSVDGKARLLGLYPTRAEACVEMHLAAKQYYDDLGLDSIGLYPDSASVGSTDECGCEYKIEPVKIKVYDGELKGGRDGRA